MLALVLAVGGAQAEIYKWIDADGVTQFSERKPQSESAFETVTYGTVAKSKRAEQGAEPAAAGDAPPATRDDAAEEPVICEGNDGATAIGVLAMVLNRSYIASVPEFVADNASVFDADEVYTCIDTIIQNAPLHEQLAGSDTSPASPNAPLAVLLETSGTLVAALRQLSDGVTTEWKKILHHMQKRQPRLEADIEELTRLLRSVVADARSGAQVGTT